LYASLARIARLAKSILEAACRFGIELTLYPDGT